MLIMNKYEDHRAAAAAVQSNFIAENPFRKLSGAAAGSVVVLFTGLLLLLMLTSVERLRCAVAETLSAMIIANGGYAAA